MLSASPQWFSQALQMKQMDISWHPEEALTEAAYLQLRSDKGVAESWQLQEALQLLPATPIVLQHISVLQPLTDCFCCALEALQLVHFEYEVNDGGLSMTLSMVRVHGLPGRHRQRAAGRVTKEPLLEKGAA